MRYRYISCLSAPIDTTGNVTTNSPWFPVVAQILSVGSAKHETNSFLRSISNKVSAFKIGDANSSALAHCTGFVTDVIA